MINPQNANTAYFGDTDGRVGAVLYALLVSGHIGIREKGWSLLCDLLEHEDMASFAYENKKLEKLFTLLDKRDMILNELHQHVFLKCDAITPCIFLGDHTGDRFREGANKRGNSSRLTQSFHFFMFEPIFSPVNALNQPI